MLNSKILKPISFSEVAGWQGDDFGHAFEAFLKSARQMAEKPYRSRALGIQAGALGQIGSAALEAGLLEGNQARNFFEDHFLPCRIRPDDGSSGFVTGYYEPETVASRNRTDKFPVPLYRRSDDLVDVNDDNRPPGMASQFRYGLKAGERITEYPDREMIQNGCLEGKGLELVWLPDRVEAFFIHVQGSARLRFEDGSLMRVTYAAKSGHPYTSIAKVLCKRLDLDPSKMTADRLREWMYNHPQELDALLAHNRSYIFFSEVSSLKPDDGPMAAAKTPLIAGRSLAVDRTLHTFGSPIWVETENPLPGETKPWQRLMIAQDTGSAIVGPARGDLFMGSGSQAGLIAGRIRHQANMVVLVPKSQLQVTFQ